jgi:putative ATPase
MIRFAWRYRNVDPQALQVVSAMEAFNSSVFREATALVQAAVYLATAPKSNALYVAFQKVQADVREMRNMPVPLHLRNAPTSFMKEMGYGKEYKYPHNYPEHFVEEEYLPENLKGRLYYQPSDEGLEREIKKRLENWRRKERG